VAAASTLGTETFIVIGATLGFAHFLLALIYSRRKIKLLMTSGKSASYFSITMIAGVLLAVVQFPIVYLTVLHHNFNEVYMRQALKVGFPQLRSLRLSCLALNMSLFAAILRHSVGLNTVDPRFFFAAVALSGLWYVWELVRNRRNMTVKQAIDNSIYEVMSFALLGLSFFYNISLMHVFLYHFTYWALYPIPKMASKGTVSLGSYLALHLLALPVIWLITTGGSSQFVNDSVLLWFAWGGYIHNATSFALSDEQPGWLVDLFQGPAKRLRDGLRGSAPAETRATQLVG
jgi:hypothetical protein